jgi:hypothetical protein
MPTNLALDDQLIEEARKFSSLNTKSPKATQDFLTHRATRLTSR